MLLADRPSIAGILEARWHGQGTLDSGTFGPALYGNSSMIGSNLVLRIDSAYDVKFNLRHRGQWNELRNGYTVAVTLPTRIVMSNRHFRSPSLLVLHLLRYISIFFKSTREINTTSSESTRNDAPQLRAP
ncbi:hypothetical protein VTN00DRAFT_4317 [Thermoascus crustaceus]|uniref:uncharacterized protein n=1 Tax=Thermoascus crustaceus TaxID=5088 RepID=UPI0037436C27